MMNTSASNRPRILVAEQDDALGNLLETILQTEHYDADVAPTLEDALAKVDDSLYDLVVTDLFVTRPPARLDGARRLRRSCQPTPVGILTSWPVPPEEAKHDGFVFVLPKPFDLEVLLERIAALLNKSFTPEQQQQVRVIKAFLEALSTGAWEMLRALCTPDVGYYPLTRSVFTKAREIKGINAYLDFVQQAASRLPDFAIDQSVIFQQRKDLVARYRASWRGPDSQRQGITGSVICRFRGERIFQIAVAQNRQRLLALLEPPQPAGE